MKPYKNFLTCPIDKIKCHFCFSEDNVMYCGKGATIKRNKKKVIISDLETMVKLNVLCPLDDRAKFSARIQTIGGNDVQFF